MVKYGPDDFITFDEASGPPYAVCTYCLVLLQVGSYDQHLVSTNKCLIRFLMGVDLFSELQGGKGLKKHDSEKFFINYAENTALKKKYFSPPIDIAQKTDAFKAFAEEKLEDLCHKCQHRNFFLLERDGVKAMLISPYLVSGKVKGLCVCKNEDGEFCGHVCCLNKVAKHLAKEHTKVKTNRKLKKAWCVDITIAENLHHLSCLHTSSLIIKAGHISYATHSKMPIVL